MAKKRKSDATRLDEVDRTMYTTFCSAANSLSQLYTQAMNHQRLSFQAGERQGLEKLYQWIVRQQEEGSRVTTPDIVAYLQNELDYGAEEPPMSPRMLLQQQHLQTAMHSTNLGPTVPAAPTPAGQGLRWGNSDQQAKNSVFSNALSSPVRQSLQPYHLAAQGSYHSSNFMPYGNGPRSNPEANYNHHQNRDTPMSNDSLDMHADSPDNGFPR
ncbi:nuclear receptor family 2 group C protein [Trema orientale]|uniref:Nuclear receptor family 2 group C protein n=1 Tax=Trema orientale TaxID=63057 RepID=A0A2P5BTY2_TREOI|nr:nuclear receptor family 2 group C protein [Trema orientale]